MINEQDRTILLHLIGSPEWRVLTNVAELIIRQVSQEQNMGTTIDEIAMHSLKTQGQVEGIKRLLKEIINATNGEK